MVLSSVMTESKESTNMKTVKTMRLVKLVKTVKKVKSVKTVSNNTKKEMIQRKRNAKTIYCLHDRKLNYTHSATGENCELGETRENEISETSENSETSETVLEALRNPMKQYVISMEP